MEGCSLPHTFLFGGLFVEWKLLVPRKYITLATGTSLGGTFGRFAVSLGLLLF